MPNELKPEQLLPCPFCGGGVTLENNQNFKNPDSDTLYWIECHNCTFDWESYSSIRNCTSAWNKRHIEHALNAELAQLRKDNQELRNRIESIETKTEELHLAVYGYGTAHDSAEYVLDNLIIDKDKVNGIVARIKNLKSDNQSLVEQMNAMAKKLEDAETKLLWKSIQT